jgi:hypothetical protein
MTSLGVCASSVGGAASPAICLGNGGRGERRSDHMSVILLPADACGLPKIWPGDCQFRVLNRCAVNK